MKTQKERILHKKKTWRVNTLQRQLSAPNLVSFFLTLALVCIVVITRSQPLDWHLGDEYLTKADSLYALNKYDRATFYYQSALSVYEKSGDCEGTFMSKAQLHLMQGLSTDPHQGIQSLSRLLSTVHCCPMDQEGIQAVIWQGLGTIYNQQRQYDSALYYHHKAWKGFELTQGKAHKKRPDCLIKMGKTYSRLEEFQKTDSLYHSALGILSKISDTQPLALGRAYSDLGDNYSKWGKLKLALKYHQQAFGLYQKWLPNPHPLTARGLTGLAATFDILGQYEKALYHYQKALTMRTRLFGEYSLPVANTLYKIGMVYYQKSEYSRSLEYLLKSLEIQLCQETPETLQIVEIQSNIGSVTQKLGMPDCSLEYQIKALKNLQSLKNPPLYPLASINVNIGSIYFDFGQYNKTIKYLKTASKQFETLYKGKNHMNISLCYYNLGLIYRYKEQYSLAESYLQKSLDIGLKNLDTGHPRLGDHHIILGEISKEKKKYQKAFVHYQKAKDIYYAYYGRWHEKAGILHNALGVLYISESQYDKALGHLRQALKIEIKNFGEKHYKLAVTYHSLGKAYSELGDFEEAINYQKKAIELKEKVVGKQHPELAAYHNSLGDNYLKQGYFQKSLHAYENALISNGSKPKADSLDLNHYLDGHHLLTSLSGKAKVLTQIEGCLAKAMEAYQQCDRLIDQLRKSTYLESDKVELGVTASKVYQEAIGCSLQQTHSFSADSMMRLAFYYSEKSKAMVLYNTLKARSVQHNALLPKTLMESDHHFKKEQKQLRQQLFETNDPKHKTQIQDQLYQVTAGHQQLLAHLEQNYPDYYQIYYQSPIVPLHTIQENLDPNKALIEYFIGDSTMFIFTVSKDKIWVTPQPLSTTFYHGISKFLAQFNSPPDQQGTDISNYTRPATALYNILLKTSLSNLPRHINSLVLVPDGSLNYLNFGTLIKPNADNVRYTGFMKLHYLIRDYTLHYAGSANLWIQSIQQRQIADEKPLPPHHFGGFAPTYSSLTHTTDTISETLKNLTGTGEYPLPGAQAEVKQIAKIMKGHAWTGLRSSKALFQQKASDYQILHLAMHASIDKEEPLNSCLTFSPHGEDKLYAAEIYGMRLPSRMAVLSACQTGLGKLEKGEGVMGLSRAFSYAGCPSLTVSLWNAPDRASSGIMVHFYKNLAKGLAIDASLRKAQLGYLEEYAHSTYSHPYYWASFVTIGDMAPIRFKEGKPILIPIFVIGFISLMVIVIIKVIKRRGNAQI